MKLRRKIAILLALLLLASLPLITTAVADLGDFSGGGDYGGGSGSSSDDCDGIGWAIYYILRIGCVIGEAAEDAGCSHGQVIVFEILFFSVAIGILVLFVRVRSRISGRRDRGKVGDTGTAQAARSFTPPGPDVFSRVKAVDPNFSEQDLLEKLKNLYFRFVDCRAARDLAPIRPYLSDEMSRRTEAELNEFARTHVTERTERLAILDAKLTGYTRTDGEDVLLARLTTRCVRYLKNDETGALVSGSVSDEIFESVTFELTRPAGTVTGSRETGTTVRNCPYCGAPLSLNESSQCPYCDSVLPAGRDEWIIRSVHRG